MIGSVCKRNLHINHRIPGNKAFLQLLNNSLLYSRPILLGEDSADNFIDKLEAPSSRKWLELDPAIPELSAAAGLFLVPSLRPGAGLDRLPVGNLRCLHGNLHAEFPLELVECHLQVYLPHARQDHLLRLLIPRKADSRILLEYPVETDAHLIFVALGLRCYGI